MIKKLAVAATAASILGFTGCASILNDQTQAVNVVTSNGQKVQASVDGQSFEAPGVVNLKRQNVNKLITTTDANCSSSTVANKKVDTVFFVNILSGGAFGSTTDYSTEKMWKYDDTVTIACK